MDEYGNALCLASFILLHAKTKDIELCALGLNLSMW